MNPTSGSAATPIPPCARLAAVCAAVEGRAITCPAAMKQTCTTLAALRRMTLQTNHSVGRLHPTRAGPGGSSTFVLSQSGDVQSLINPPGNPKARFLTNAGVHATPDEFLAGAETDTGSWWPHWHAWLDTRSGARAAAAADPQPSLGAAPGAYLREPA